MKVDWSYPWIWGLDLKSYYKSLWLGWWLITWRFEWDQGLEEIGLHISFQPGL